MSTLERFRPSIHALLCICLLGQLLLLPAPLRASDGWSERVARCRSVLDVAPDASLQLLRDEAMPYGIRLGALPIPLDSGGFHPTEARIYELEAGEEARAWPELTAAHGNCLLVVLLRGEGNGREFLLHLPESGLLLRGELLSPLLGAFARATERSSTGGESSRGDWSFRSRLDGLRLEELAFVIESHFRRLAGFTKLNALPRHQAVRLADGEELVYTVEGSPSRRSPTRWPLDPRSLRPRLDAARVLRELEDEIRAGALELVDELGDSFRFVLALPIARYLQILFSRFELQGVRLSTVTECLEDAVDEALTTPIVFAGVSYTGLDRAIGMAVDRGVASSLTRTIPGSAFAKTLPFLVANLVTHQLFLHDYSDIVDSDGPAGEKLVLFLRRVCDMSIWTRDRLVPIASQMLGMAAVQAGVTALASASASVASFVASPLGGFLVGTLTFLVGSILADLAHRFLESFDGGQVANHRELIRHVEEQVCLHGDLPYLRADLMELLLKADGSGLIRDFQEASEKHLQNLDERRMAYCADVTMRIRQLRNRLRRESDPLRLPPNALMAILRCRPLEGGEGYETLRPWEMANRVLQLRVQRRYAEFLDATDPEEASFEAFLARIDAMEINRQFDEDFRQALDLERRCLEDPTMEERCREVHASWTRSVETEKAEAQAREALLATELEERLRSFLLGDPTLDGAAREEWFLQQIRHATATLHGEVAYEAPRLGSDRQGLIPRIFEEWCFNRGVLERRSFGAEGEAIYAHLRERNAHLERSGLTPLLRLLADGSLGTQPSLSELLRAGD